MHKTWWHCKTYNLTLIMKFFQKSHYVFLLTIHKSTWIEECLLRERVKNTTSVAEMTNAIVKNNSGLKESGSDKLCDGRSRDVDVDGGGGSGRQWKKERKWGGSDCWRVGQASSDASLHCNHIQLLHLRVGVCNLQRKSA